MKLYIQLNDHNNTFNLIDPFGPIVFINGSGRQDPFTRIQTWFNNGLFNGKRDLKTVSVAHVLL